MSGILIENVSKTYQLDKVKINGLVDLSLRIVPNRIRGVIPTIYYGQIMPTALRPDIRDVTTPHLIRRTNLEFAIEMVRDIDPFGRSLLVGMAARLLADQPEFFHLVLDQGYSHLEASRSVGVGETVLRRWVQQLQMERQGVTLA
jgi:hypothetical protein